MIGTSILIVDDHRLFADVIASALEQQGARIVGQVETAADAIAVAARQKPDVVLLDLGLPDSDGIDAGKAILAAHPDTVVVALTASTDRRAAAAALRAGFLGYVSKEARLQVVVKAIRSGMAGRVAVTQPSRAETSKVKGSSATLMASGLTKREREVLALIVAGAGSKAISYRLHITTNTVRTHVQSILTKLQVHSRLEAAAFAVRHGLVEPVGTSGGIREFRRESRKDSAHRVEGLPRTGSASPYADG